MALSLLLGARDFGSPSGLGPAGPTRPRLAKGVGDAVLVANEGSLDRGGCTVTKGPDLTQTMSQERDFVSWVDF